MEQETSHGPFWAILVLSVLFNFPLLQDTGQRPYSRTHWPLRTLLWLVLGLLMLVGAYVTPWAYFVINLFLIPAAVFILTVNCHQVETDYGHVERLRREQAQAAAKVQVAAIRPAEIRTRHIET